MLRISSSQEHLLLIHASEKYMEMFPCKPTYSTLVPLMCFRLTGHSNQHQVLPPTIHNSWTQHVPLAFFLPANKHQTFYVDVFRWRVPKAATLDVKLCPAVVHANFETAIPKVVPTVWPSC